MNSINQLIVVMKARSVFFEVEAEVLNKKYVSFGVLKRKT
jgi:hypothetical protein